jgi:ParB family chromosome partitioning protein
MRRALGKGLSQLIGEQFESNSTELPVDAIVPNTRQPRSYFADEPLKELASSIREFGVLQPLLVRPLDESTFELIAGERRLRAAKLAGLNVVPVIIRAAGGQTSLELALIENLQRQDINALESARAYRRLVEEFGLTQEQVAERVGKSRTTITNTMRLLRLPPKIQESVQSGFLSEGHARALVGIEEEDKQLAIFEQIKKKGLSVRDVERAARTRPGQSERAATQPHQKLAGKPARNPDLIAVEEALSEKLGTPVQIGGGEISIEYYSEEDLQRILEILGVAG